MKIGYDEKTDSYFITEMTRMESGVIFMSVMKSLKTFKEAGEGMVQEIGKEKFTTAEIKDAMRAQKDIVAGLIIAREMENAIKKS